MLITEHRYSRLSKIYAEKRAGRFCVQFITFNQDEESRKILLTWQAQCIDWCYARYEDGKFGDQKYLDDFGKIFLNSKDIMDLGLFSGNEVHVSNEFGSAKYILSELDSLKPGVALIYHGLSSPHDGISNVNFFTPDVPEELGFSGSYNSVIIQIQKA